MSTKTSKLIFIAMSLMLSIFTTISAQQINDIRYYQQAKDGYKPSVPYGNNIAVGKYAQTDDAKIYYETYGKGKPLVILHGGVVGSTAEMGQLIDSLSLHYKVIAISTRGHGKSEMGSEIPSYDQKAKDVKEVLLNENISEKITILGFSDGAYTGYFFAHNYPDKTERLIAIGAGVWKKDFRTFDFTYKNIYKTDNLYWDQQMLLKPEPQRIDEWFTSINKYYSSLDLDTKFFENIQCPVLVLAGEKDQNAPLSTILAANYVLPNAQLGIIPNAPHPVINTNFAAVWSCIIPFLNQ